MRFAALVVALATFACESPVRPYRVLGTGVARTSVAELLSVPEAYSGIWVQFLGWSADDPGPTVIYMSKDHAVSYDRGAAIYIAPKALPDPVPCPDMLVFIEGTFGIIPEYEQYGLLRVRRIWSSELRPAVSESGYKELRTVCSWWNQEFPPPKAMKPDTE